MSPEIREAFDLFHEFMFERLNHNPRQKGGEQGGEYPARDLGILCQLSGSAAPDYRLSLSATGWSGRNGLCLRHDGQLCHGNLRRYLHPLAWSVK
jgi:hypothetical protein